MVILGGGEGIGSEGFTINDKVVAVKGFGLKTL